MISSQARYDHFDTAPYMLNRCFSSLFFGEKSEERTDGKNNKIFGFSNCVTPHGYWIFRGRN